MSIKPVYQFHDDTRSVRIHQSELPTPWINYLSNGRLHAFVSQAGEAWRGGRADYLSDDPLSLSECSDGWAGVFIPTFERKMEPLGRLAIVRVRPLDDWHAEHHAGWSEFQGNQNGVTAKLKLFCAMDTDALCYEVEIKNHSDERKSSIFCLCGLGSVRVDDRFVLWLLHSVSGDYVL